jgi:hypothetical protein
VYGIPGPSGAQLGGARVVGFSIFTFANP